MTAVVRSRTGTCIHHAGCRTLRRPGRPATPTVGQWHALADWWTTGRWDSGTWVAPPSPWASCCAARVCTAAGWPDRPPSPIPVPVGVPTGDRDDDRWLGTLTVQLCARAADAWAAGREDAAHRWFDVACCIPGQFHDEVPLDREQRP